MLEGIDVSAYQTDVDWQKVRASGVAFAFIKVSEGVGYTDPLAASHWAGARAAGLALGAYHFARPDLNDAETEAGAILRALPALAPGDLVIVDIEVGRGVDRSGWLLDLCGRLERSLGWPPVVYSYLDYIRTTLTAARLARYPLWLADYAPLVPARVPPWPQVAIWQYTSEGTVPGIAGLVDRNRLSRDLAGLKALGKPGAGHRARAACALKPTPDHTSAALAQLAAGEPLAPVPIAGWTLVRTAGGAVGWIPDGDLA